MQQLIAYAVNISGLREGLIAQALAAGVNLDLIDGARSEGLSLKEEGVAREHYMIEKINSAKKYGEPGVLGIFGAGHLSNRLGLKGDILPSMQSVLGLSEQRVHQTAHDYRDKETGVEYFPAMPRPESEKLTSPMSDTMGYVVAKESKVPGFKGVVLYEEPEYFSHVVLNGVGEKVDEQIARIKNKYPSTTTVFDVDKDGELKYVSGNGLHMAYALVSKAYIFGDAQSPSNYPAKYLDALRPKMGIEDVHFVVKDFYVRRNGDLKSGGKKSFDQYLVMNTDSHNPVVNRAVQRLLNKHPGNSVEVKANSELIDVLGSLKKGSVKLDVVGAGTGGRFGDMAGEDIAYVVKLLGTELGAVTRKLTLVGCEAGTCSPHQPALSDDVQQALQPLPIAVKGYEQAVTVDAAGHKQPAVTSTD